MIHNWNTHTKNQARYIYVWNISCKEEFVGNKVKGKISRWEVTRKQSTLNLPINEHFLPLDTQTCVSGSKKCSFYRRFDLLCFLVTSILKYILSPLYDALTPYLYIPTISFPFCSITLQQCSTSNGTFYKITRFNENKKIIVPSNIKHYKRCSWRKISETHDKWSLRKKCPYSDFFWSAFSRIWTDTEIYY